MKVPVSHIAELAHINLSEAQLNDLKKKLTDIASYMAQITELNLNSVIETNGISEEENVWREDEIQPSFTQQEAIQNSHRTFEGFFVVKQILDQN